MNKVWFWDLNQTIFPFNQLQIFCFSLFLFYPHQFSWNPWIQKIEFSSTLLLPFHSAHVLLHRGAWGEECPGTWLLPLVAGLFAFIAPFPRLCSFHEVSSQAPQGWDRDERPLSTARGVWRSTLTFLSNHLTTWLGGTREVSMHLHALCRPTVENHRVSVFFPSAGTQ